MNQTTKAALASAWAAVKGDGCTNAPDLIYSDACRQHDADYTTHTDERGAALTRADADRRLRLAMSKAGRGSLIAGWLLPWTYWAAVRLFGGNYWRKATPADEMNT